VCDCRIFLLQKKMTLNYVYETKRSDSLKANKADTQKHTHLQAHKAGHAANLQKSVLFLPG
jgi:hypothetical protein